MHSLFEYKLLKKSLFVLFFLVLSLSFLSLKAFATDFWHITMGSGITNINKVITTVDGKFLAMGVQNVSAKLRTVIGKINQDGTVDTSFGTNGFVTLVNNDLTSHLLGRDMVQNSDGSIVITGNYSLGLSQSWANIFVLKLQADGSKDTTFGTNGYFGYGSTSSGAESSANSIAKTSDGGFLIAGHVHSDATDPGHYDAKFYNEAILIKLNSSGQLDTGFGVSSSGRTLLKISVTDQEFNKVLVDGNGKIYACGSSGTVPFVYRFNSNGTLDTTYNGTKGHIFFYYGTQNGNLTNCALQPDGKLVAVDSQFILSPSSDYVGYSIRLNTNGTLDTSYGTSGVARIVVPSGKTFMFEDIAVDSNNKIIIEGRTDIDTDFRFAVLRLTPSGALDNTFDSNGIVHYTPGAAMSGDHSSVLPLVDGGYLVYGGAGQMFKIDSSGHISGCSSQASDTTRTLTGNITTSTASSTVLYNIGTTDIRTINIATNTAAIGGVCSYNDGLSFSPTPTQTPTPTLTPTPAPTALPPAPPEESGVEIVDEDFTDVLQTNLQGIVTLGVADILSGAPIALLDIDTSLVSGEFIWDSLTGASEGTRSVLHYPGGIDDLPGISGGEFILFVPKGDGTSVLICPGATTLNQVIIGCTNGYFLDEYAPNVTIENINGIDYWKVTGLTGTGGMSVIMGIKDVLSRLQVDVLADHRISFGTNYGINSGENLVIEFDPANKAFDLGGLTISDIVLTDSSSNDRTLAGTAGAGIWGVSIDTVNDSITFTAPTNSVGLFEEAKAVIVIIGGTNKIKNPANVSSVQEVVTIYNTIGEQGTVSIPIVDSDTVDVSGYVTAFIHFDIDTNTDNTDCAYNVCKVHGGVGAGTADNYTVDLGELTSTLVNKSNSMSVNHSDGGTGIINSIYFDLTSNSPGGVVVTVKSLNSGLQGPGTNMINSVVDGLDIAANSGLYGLNLTTGSTQKHGSIVVNSLCDLSTEFCGPDSTPKTVFDTNNLPIDSARVRMDLAAAASYTNNPGVYTDTLTFVATGTF
jgi:uncharacterized delta-60 repeat protein